MVKFLLPVHSENLHACAATAARSHATAIDSELKSFGSESNIILK